MAGCAAIVLGVKSLPFVQLTTLAVAAYYTSHDRQDTEQHEATLLQQDVLILYNGKRFHGIGSDVNDSDAQIRCTYSFAKNMFLAWASWFVVLPVDLHIKCGTKGGSKQLSGVSLTDETA